MKSTQRRAPRKSLRILGVMTGTSCDGLDAALVETDLKSWRTLWSASTEYPSSLRKRVLELQRPGATTSLKDFVALDRDLGEWYGRVLKQAIDEHPRRAPHAIASHGQTVSHFPGKNGGGSTLQLGNPAVIAAATDLTVISHFRDGDMAAGGQGAPLIPLFHRILADSLGERGVAIHNIGGISNLTYVPPKGEVLAFDTGPGNIWIDAAMTEATGGRHKFDRGGALALSALAEIDRVAVERILRNSYFAQPAPKSTGRDDFPYELFREATESSGAARVATATAITVDSIARAYRDFVLSRKLPLSRILVCGGGAYNEALIQGLRQRLAPVRVDSIAAVGLDPSLIEAQGFAMFGAYSLLGRGIGGPWTGVRGFGPPGWVTPGSNWKRVLQLVTSIQSSP